MRIILVNKFWYLRGGTERVVFLTKQLLEEAGHTVEVFGMRHPDNNISNDYFIDNLDYESLQGLSKIRAGLKAIYNHDARNKFEKLVKNFKPDVIHFHNIYHQLSYSLIDVVHKYHIPSVMTLHDYNLISPNYTLFHHGAIHEESQKGSYYRCILNNCMEHVGESIVATASAYKKKWMKVQDSIHAYIAPSEFLKQKHIAYGISPHLIEVIPNPLDMDSFADTATVGKNVVYAGRLSEEKGLDILLDAAKKLPAIPFLIIGTGPLEQHIKHRIKDEHLDHVVWGGYKKGDEYISCLNHARLLVVPSLWYENCPMSIVEAQASGKVVVASDIGGIPELLPATMLATPGNVDAWASRINEWYQKSDKELIKAGDVLRKSAQKKHDPQTYIRSVLKVYHCAQSNV